jgi:signal transduction histidine kinase
LKLQIQDAREILADRELLFEAVGNLVGNAIKFTPTGGRIQLALKSSARGPAIEVSDNGPGVPEEEREVVVQRFYRGRHSQGTPGSGLGLSIVCAIARLHDFRLQLTDAQPGLQATLECWPASG